MPVPDGEWVHEPEVLGCKAALVRDFPHQDALLVNPDRRYPQGLAPTARFSLPPLSPRQLAAALDRVMERAAGLEDARGASTVYSAGTVVAPRVLLTRPSDLRSGSHFPPKRREWPAPGSAPAPQPMRRRTPPLLTPSAHRRPIGDIRLVQQLPGGH
jgi:hypothetical protein